MANSPLFATPLYEAVIVTVMFLLTGNVVIEKVAIVAPAFTTIAVGTLAFVGLLLARATTIPPTGAGAMSVTVPVALAPPQTPTGFTVSEDRAGDGAGWTVKLAVFVT